VIVIPTAGGAWINMRGSLWRVASEQMRPATSDESKGIEVVNRFLETMKMDLQTTRGPKKFLDITREGRPRFDNEDADLPELESDNEDDDDTRVPEDNASPAADISEIGQDFSPARFRGEVSARMRENQPKNREHRERSPRRDPQSPLSEPAVQVSPAAGPSGRQMADNMYRAGMEPHERLRAEPYTPPRATSSHSQFPYPVDRATSNHFVESTDDIDTTDEAKIFFAHQAEAFYN